MPESFTEPSFAGYASTPGMTPPPHMNPWAAGVSAVESGGLSEPADWRMKLMDFGSGLTQGTPFQGLNQGMRNVYMSKFGMGPTQVAVEQKKKEQALKKMLGGAYGPSGGGSDAAAAMALGGDAEGARQAYKLSWEKKREEDKMAKAQDALTKLLNNQGNVAARGGKALTPDQVEAVVFLSQFREDELADLVKRITAPEPVVSLTIPKVGE